MIINKVAREVLEEWGRRKVFEWEKDDEFRADMRELTDLIACAVMMSCITPEPKSICPSCAALPGAQP